MPLSSIDQKTVANRGSFDVNPAPMRRSLPVVLITLAAAACIEIPDNIHAEFAGPKANDRSNYRPGTHGSALPFEENKPPVVKAAADAGATTSDADASAPPASDNDGGTGT
jgi:hypothetical protein